MKNGRSDQDTKVIGDQERNDLLNAVKTDVTKREWFEIKRVLLLQKYDQILTTLIECSKYGGTTTRTSSFTEEAQTDAGAGEKERFWHIGES